MKLLENCVRASKSHAAHSRWNSKTHLYTQKTKMHSFRVHRRHLCICVLMCVPCVSVGAHTCVCSCWWRPKGLWVSFPIIFPPYIFGAGSLTDLASLSMAWNWPSRLGRLASDLSRAPLSSSQSWDYRGVPPCLAFYKGAATQTQVSLLSQQACYRQNHFYRHGSIFQQNTWGSHTCV